MGEFGEYGDGIRLTCGEGDSRVNGDFNVEADIVSKRSKIFGSSQKLGTGAGMEKVWKVVTRHVLERMLSCSLNQLRLTMLL
jgi:hypothetical protein